MLNKTAQADQVGPSLFLAATFQQSLLCRVTPYNRVSIAQRLGYDSDLVAIRLKQSELPVKVGGDAQHACEQSLLTRRLVKLPRLRVTQ